MPVSGRGIYVVANMKRSIVFIRHAEKEEGGSHLSPEGVYRARLIRDIFENGDLKHSIAKPTSLIANYIRSKASFETLLPLSRSLNIPIDATHSRRDVSEAANAVYNSWHFTGGSVIVAWDHKNIYDLVTRLGGRELPISVVDWPPHEYDTAIIMYPDNGDAPPKTIVIEDIYS